MNPVRSFLLVFLLLPLSLAGQDVGTVTFVEGGLRLIRGTAVLQGVEGMRLRAGDILESSDPGFAQLEFAKGTVVALGAATRAFLLHTGGRSEQRTPAGAELVMLSGWLKGETHSDAGPYRYDTPLLAASTRDGTVLLHTAAGASEIYLESGSALAGEVTPDGSWPRPAAAKAGQFFSRRAGKVTATASRPDAAFLGSMPRPFRDTLPPRLSRFSGKPAEPRRDHEVSYAEVQPWLTMAYAWRRGFVQRFQPRLRDAAFRAALEQHLKDHPEWDPILHPEKYPPKTAAPPPDKSDSSHGRY
jgi:hypothetical protein